MDNLDREIIFLIIHFQLHIFQKINKKDCHYVQFSLEKLTISQDNCDAVAIISRRFARKVIGNKKNGAKRNEQKSECFLQVNFRMKLRATLEASRSTI